MIHVSDIKEAVLKPLRKMLIKITLKLKINKQIQ